jgi:AcrR family transcriptional regulator
MLELIHDQMSDFKRDPVRTREKLLLSAFEQIHRHGFQAVSLDEILKDTGVTKGALYHHFPNKNALGYAVIDEVISPSLENFWVKPVVDALDPLSALQAVILDAGENMTRCRLCSILHYCIPGRLHWHGKECPEYAAIDAVWRGYHPLP